MKSRGFRRRCVIALTFVSCLAGILPVANAIPGFQTIDSRLPNPARPYEMVGGTVHYDSAPHFAVYDLEFAPSNPSQLTWPTRNPDGSLEFDSTFDITYKAVISFSTQPSHAVSGIGTARARGFAPDESNWPNPQVFDSELVEFNLFSLSAIPEVMFRESPGQRSSGVIIRENTCPLCLAPVTYWRVSSFFDIATEITFNGGVTWTAARDAIHVEQAPDGYPPGDYNKDKVVDSADYVVWRRMVGETGAGLAADGDWSGAVEAGDYDVWKRNIGSSSVVGAGSATIPEPAAIVMMVLGLLTLRIGRWSVAA